MLSVARLKAIGPWFWEMKYLWLAIGVTMAALAVSLRPHTSEPVIRLTGLVLQILGIATVAWGISETRALFGHASLVGKWRKWIARFPLLRQNTVISVGGASLVVTGGKARGYGTVGAGPNATVEARIDALEQNVKSIYERIGATQKEMDEEFQKAAGALKDEVQSRKDEDEAIRNKVGGNRDRRRPHLSHRRILVVRRRYPQHRSSRDLQMLELSEMPNTYEASLCQ